MKYRIDIYDTHEIYVASEEFSVFESPTPIPIPNIGDYIHLPNGCGPNGKQSKDVKVKKREFTYIPKGQNSDSCVRVQLFCCD